MRRSDFSDWLKARGISDKARSTRIHAVARIEKIMQALGSPYSDLDGAYDQDELKQLRDAVGNLRSDAAKGGEQFRILLPGASKPQSRLTNFRAWLGQYRQFRADPGAGIRRSTWPGLEDMRDEFLRRVPDFRDFEEQDGLYYEVERSYKETMLAAFRKVVANGGSDRDLGARVYKVLIPNSGPLLRWQTADTIEKQHPESADEFYAILGRLARSEGEPRSATTAAINALAQLGVHTLTVGEILSISLTIAGFAHPKYSAPFKMTKARELASRLDGNPIFSSGVPATEEQILRWLNLLERVFAVMRDEWHWKPRDLLDVQGFAWAVLDRNWIIDDDNSDMEDGNLTMTENEREPAATNLILYGPPGTGKTFATAAEAVRLCDGFVPDDRRALMQRYQLLAKSGQIRFVTFHQSYSYEDFVEGLRPVTEDGSGSEGAEAVAPKAGFSLKPHAGIFREICQVAEQARTRPRTASPFDLTGKRTFKMSLGRAGAEDYIYDAAIAANYIVIGWGGEQDWSDPRFDDERAILERWREMEPETTDIKGRVRQFIDFRNTMKAGDIVVVSDGNSKFRAIGEIAGPYAYDPTGERTYSHRRPVKWLLVLEESLPVENISVKQFSMASCYELKDHVLKKEALSRLLSSEPESTVGPVDQFVLIIDEINRANMSKVFGELITLIESDKRLGAGDNALTVRLPYSGVEFGVPNNLHIVATMNTADRSIALLDTALRRRFTFRELMPSPEVLEEASDRTGVDLKQLLTIMNQRIEYLFDREHQIGHAYFYGCGTREEVDAVMRHKVIPLLAEYFYEDWSKVAIVLGETMGRARFLDRSELRPPAELIEDGAESRVKWSVRPTFAEDAYEGLA